MTKFKSKTATKARYDEDDDGLPRRKTREERRGPKVNRRERKDRYDEDDDDDDGGRAETRSGWSGYDKTKSETAAYADEVKLSQDPQLFRFLFPEPTEVYREHWVTRDGKRSWTCVGTKAKNGVGDCPLCALDLDARTKSAFWVMVWDLDEPDAPPVLKRLIAGPMLTDQLKSYHENRVSGPLDKMYYTIAITGKKKSTSYPQLGVKARDLEEDYGIAPLTKEKLQELRAEAKKQKGVYLNSYKEVLKVARETVGEEDDDDDDDDD